MSEHGAHWHIAPCIIVDDVQSTADYYRDVLGFQYNRIWGEPPCFCMVMRAGVVIMLKQLPTKGNMHPNHLSDATDENWDAYLWIDDADALYEEYKQKGVKITRGICDQEYGNRDFEIEDCNGYRLRFGHNTERS
jgi:predicted enzyme related to lactoylglutathione lyase